MRPIPRRLRDAQAIRDVTPSGDKPPCQPAWSPPSPEPVAGGVGRYLPAGYRAKTLDDLRTSCGKYSDAAVNEAEAFAITTWIMKEASDLDLGAPAEVVCAALCRVGGSRRIAEGYPSITGIPELHTLADFSPAAATEAKQIYADVYAQWKTAGSPHLASAVQGVRQTINVIFLREDALSKELSA